MPTINCNIHGNIHLCKLASKIVDTEEFQRLRNIKQLGCVSYIFPTAVHTRFEHSLGVYHLSKIYMKILNKFHMNFNRTEYALISIAALIHDLGHGPYSHLYDDWQNICNHEYRSIEIFKMMNKKYNFGLSEKNIQFIYNVIDPKFLNEKKPYLFQIVSNKSGIDVDRIDYMMRDCKNLGLAYGIEYLKIMNNSGIEHGEIVYNSKARLPIDDFLRTRFLLYREIYNHKTVVSIEMGIKEIFEELDEYFNIRTCLEQGDWKKFVSMDDNIISFLTLMPFSVLLDKSQRILKDIKSRNIYKLVGEVISDKELDIVSEKEDVIISKRQIKYYSEEKPKFIKNEQVKILKSDENNCDEYITRIYINPHNIDSESMSYATELFKSICY